MPSGQELCKFQNYKSTLLKKVFLIIKNFFLHSSHTVLPSNPNRNTTSSKKPCVDSSLPSEAPDVLSAHFTFFLLNTISHTFLFLSYYIYLRPGLKSPTVLSSQGAYSPCVNHSNKSNSIQHSTLYKINGLIKLLNSTNIKHQKHSIVHKKALFTEVQKVKNVHKLLMYIGHFGLSN